ncbi:MAG: class I SAM-dependent methyltransferase [Deltaproteobacteria bacterium]|nr:class I SAM-dependent methyltransferase [Deltaproteobacteria bacterium]
MNTNRGRVCPVERAGSLDNVFRRLLQNPLKILAPYIQEGIVALDVGCGPGFFTLTMAQLVGSTGRVIGVDLQEGMLEKIRRKIRETEFENRIALHKCEGNSIGVAEQVDFVLLFYMVHEVPNKDEFFTEIARLLKPTGKVLIVEPPFHVSKAAFESTLRTAEKAGFKHSRGPRILLSKTSILQRGQ